MMARIGRVSRRRYRRGRSRSKWWSRVIACVAVPLSRRVARAREAALACGLALLVAVVCTAPAWLAGRPAGKRTVDGLGTWWFQWWVDTALAHHNSLLWTDRFFYPWGKDILRDAGGNVLDALATVPFRRWYGPVVGWNALYTAILASNGLVALGWVRRRGASLPAALAAALVAGLYPYALFELAHGRPTQALLAPLVAALAAADEAFRERRMARSLALEVVAGLLLGLQGWVYWYAAGLGALALVVLALARHDRRAVLGVGVAGGVALAVTAPAVVPLFRLLGSGGAGGVLRVGEWMRGIADFRNASGEAVNLGVLGQPLVVGFQGARGWHPVGVAMTVGAYALALAGGLAGRRWLVVVVLAMGVAIGPFPGGVPNPLYIGLAAVLLPMARFYWPYRALALLLPASALGAATLVDRVGSRWLVAGVVAMVMAGEVAVRNLVPLATWDPKVDVAWRCLARAQGAVIVLPYGIDHEPLLAQTVHGRPMLGGMNPRSVHLVPAEQQAFRTNNSWLRALLLAPVDPRASLDWTPEDKAAVGALGYRWVVVRRFELRDRRPGPGRWQRARAARKRLALVAGEPVFTDDQVAIYAPWGGSFSCHSPP